MPSMSFIRQSTKLFALISAFSFSASSQAVVVNPGGVAVLTGTTSAASPDLAGVVIRDELLPFQIFDRAGNLVMEGVVQDRVVRSDNTGTLIFAPRLRDFNMNLPDAWVQGLVVNGYDGFATDVDYRTDGQGNVGPNSVNRSPVSGDDLFFRYDPNIITPNFGDEGRFNSILTDTAAFDLTGSITILASNDFGGTLFSVTLDNTAAPSLVPVPAAAWLFGSGLLGLVGLARRKA